MKLKNGLRVLWRNQHEIQIGSDPRLARTFWIEHPREFDVIQLLETDRTAAQLRRQLAAAGGRRERIDQLLREIRDAGLMNTTNHVTTAEMQVPPTRRDLLAAEAETRSLIEDDGWQTLAQRVNQRVSIYGLGRTGAHTAVALATSGVGLLQLIDSRPVRQRDRGPIYSRESIGQPRAEALAEFIQRQDLDCETRTHGRLSRPDVAVMVGEEVADPARAAFLSSHSIKHLSVVTAELSITCGPWVPERSGPCLRCQRLWAVENDPCWPGLATQRFTRSAVAARGEDPNLAAMAGHLAATQVLEGLAGRRPPTLAHTVTVSLPAYELEWEEIATHPKCKSHDPRPSRTVCWKPPPNLPLPPT
ncbi:MAG: ThiF family adenylyltransferase [Bifidobacteriaceae bacterium]|jgi:hypothetical protein|nr:ThiF family adenylyltransferase [Bifidobacteriaceae bacterium]